MMSSPASALARCSAPSCSSPTARHQGTGPITGSTARSPPPSNQACPTPAISRSLIRIAKEGDIATPASGGILGGLSKGALATLGPLEARLKALLSPETLHELAQENAANRKLYVGVVNLDDGQGYAIDMTELASRIDTPAWTGKTGALQDCYVQALVASSSVPPSAYPVSLAIAEGGATRTNMYMDGGARFGVFLQQLEEALGNNVAKNTQVTVIVNGVLYSGPWLDQGKPVVKWSSLTAGARAVSLLENRFTASRWQAPRITGSPMAGSAWPLSAMKACRRGRRIRMRMSSTARPALNGLRSTICKSRSNSIRTICPACRTMAGRAVWRRHGTAGSWKRRRLGLVGRARAAFPYPSPAKAGPQLGALVIRAPVHYLCHPNWGPAFAGEARTEARLPSVQT